MNITVVSVWSSSSQASTNSSCTGQELLQQWLSKHPEIVKRASTELQPEKRTVQAQVDRSDVMKKGYTSLTGMKYPPEIGKELAKITDLPPSLLCSS